MGAKKLRVCVVGAGVSGLTALKEVLEEGHSAICFERENVPGGVFTTGVAYDPMQLTVSQYFMAYSSFPPPLEAERRPGSVRSMPTTLGAFAGDSASTGTSVSTARSRREPRGGDSPAAGGP